jgi:valyl-tRNA synthetase
MNERYDAKTEEPKWIAYWEKEGIFSYQPEAKGQVYSIDTPPPTVSGKMHIGHAFSYTQEDIIARYKRLRGFNVFYPFGTDDNGLPTERLVEKLKNVKGASMDRQAFIKLCEETLKEIRPAFVAEWKRIGMSCDFDLFYSTINDHCRRISQWSFLDLHRQGRVYRKEAPALWCPLCETAISQMECRDEEKQSTFNDIIFSANGKELVIATTRPELLPACVAVFAHPSDARYKKLFGKKAKVPLFDFEVPIIADERADPAKGTGIAMCCTFGDVVDIAWYLAYKLPLKQAIGRDGMLTVLAGKYKGMNVHKARKAILADLKAAGLLKVQKPVTHAVKVHERCGTDIEIVNSKQWFIKYLDLKEDLVKWGAELGWHPDFMKHKYDNWVKGLQWDWLISRQRFFGVPFPVWYCAKCDVPVFAAEKNLPVDPLKDKPVIKACQNCRHDKFVPEKDVLDTWATSSMTPQLAIELVPEQHRKKLFPMSLRPQGQDIISFWLFNTLVKSRLHCKKNPWKETVISGYVLDPLGEKMSKSKGNVVEPQKVLEKYSADALRYWAAGSKLGEDIAFQEKELVAGDRFVTKFWNAAKFAAMHLKDADIKKLLKQEPSFALDQWIQHRLAETIERATKDLDAYEYARAKSVIEQFFWNDFCDNYLELSKQRVYEPKNTDEKKSAQIVIAKALSALVRLFAPFTPFITEELYHRYLHAAEGFPSVHVAGWPALPKKYADAGKTGNAIVAILSAVRKKKSERKLSMKAPVKKIIIESSVDVSNALGDLKSTANALAIEKGKGKEELAPGLKVTIDF